MHGICKNKVSALSFVFCTNIAARSTTLIFTHDKSGRDVGMVAQQLVGPKRNSERTRKDSLSCMSDIYELVIQDSCTSVSPPGNKKTYTHTHTHTRTSGSLLFFGNMGATPRIVHIWSRAKKYEI